MHAQLPHSCDALQRIGVKVNESGIETTTGCLGTDHVPQATVVLALGNERADRALSVNGGMPT